MIEFTCTPENTDKVVAFLIDEVATAMKELDIKTVPANCYDKDLKNKLNALVERTDNGFWFDKQALLGVEPYGYVSDFFERLRTILQRTKKQFPELGISGAIIMNDFGAYECVLRLRVQSALTDTEVQFINQLQCIHCYQWVDADTAYEKIYDEEAIWTEDGDCLYPNAYNDDEAVFCFCSEECKGNCAD